MPFDLLFGYERVAHERAAVEVDAVYIHGGYLAVVVRRVIIYAFIGVAARGVNSQFVRAVVGQTAAASLPDSAENMEKLRQALFLAVAQSGVELGEGRAYKSRLRGQVAGQADCAHAQAVSIEFELAAKRILRLVGRQRHIVV